MPTIDSPTFGMTPIQIKNKKNHSLPERINNKGEADNGVCMVPCY